ncbi:MAG: hypothetical protein HYU53_13400 [Acidobacteria bacterium]|nr:hypothetical protein [Acidobacteriota bacterium]
MRITGFKRLHGHSVGLLPVLVNASTALTVACLPYCGQADVSAFEQSDLLHRVESAIWSLREELEPVMRVEPERADVHALALAADIAGSDSGNLARRELARRVCADAPPASDAPPVRPNEGHAAQVLLALLTVSGAWSNPPCTDGPTEVVEFEQRKSGYGLAAMLMRSALADRTRAARGGHATDEEWCDSDVRRQLTRRLTALDLSWYIQALAIAPQRAPKPFTTTWRDESDRLQSLPELIANQLAYASHARTDPSVNYLTEYGVHTLAMLVVVQDVFSQDPTAASYMVRYGQEAQRLHGELVDIALANEPETRSSLSLLAHLVQIGFCGSPYSRDWGYSPAHPTPTDSAELVRRLAARATDGSTRSGSFVLTVHMYWALENVRHRLIAGTREHSRARCACI